jgi:hypothetical protein
MNIIFGMLIVIGSIVVLLFVIGLFSKKSYSVYREIQIVRHSSEVFDFVRHLKNQDRFSKWVMTDPGMKKQYRGVDGTVGFTYAWNGNKQAGEGEQEIKAIKEGERVDVEVRFIRPFEGVASTPFEVKALSPTESRLTWGMKSSMKYPMNITLLFMNMDKLLGKDLEISLKNLKNILEG